MDADRSDADAWYDVNRRFLEAIYQCAHNAYLEESTLAVRNRLSPYRRFQRNRPGRPRKSFTEHLSIQGEVFTDLISTLPPSCVRAAAL